jgi:hypothetical protein
MTLPEAIFNSVLAICACIAAIAFFIAATGSRFPWEK